MAAPLTRLILDVILLFLILMIALREDAPEWPKLVVICLAVASSNVLLTWIFWLWVFSILPRLLAAGLILRLTLPITVRQIALVLVAYIGVHLALAVLEAFFP